MNRILLVFLIGLLIQSHSQSQTLSQYLSAAEKSMASKNYYDALNKYMEALKFDEDNIEYMYKIAESARLFGAYNVSAQHYEAVYKHKDNNLYPLASYWIGAMKMIQGDYENAKIAFTAYRAEHLGEDAYYTALADKEIKACDWALELIKNPVKGTTITLLGEQINTEYSDFAPLLHSGNLYFSSLRFRNDVIKTYPIRMVAKILLSKNSEPGIPLDDNIFNFPGKNIAHTSFNSTGNQVVYTVCEDLNDYDKRCDLYSASVDSLGNWSNHIKLPEPINKQAYSTTQPCFAYQRETKNSMLYFSSNRDGGKGGFDIWYSVIDEKGAYSEPVNVANVNTSQDDITPYYHSNSKTLYYSSKGHLGLGGFDIYSVKDGMNGWGIVKNMGVPVNSSYDDVYFTKSSKPSENYLASSRNSSAKLDISTEACCLDIYHADILPCEINLKVLVFDAITQLELNGATLKLYDLSDPGSEPIIVTHEMDNLYNFPIDCERDYKIDASKPGYLPETITFNSGKPGEFAEITKKIYLTPEKTSLDVLTFIKESGLELKGVTVSLYDLTDPTIPPVIITNLNSNLSPFDVIRCHKYKITGTKSGFDPAQKEFTVDCKAPAKVIEKLYLGGILQVFLPVVLFFDNDRPNPRSMAKTTALLYTQTYNSYSPKKQDFVYRYGQLHRNDDKTGSQELMKAFFENEVKLGKDKMDMFLKSLLSELQRGKTYEIIVKGYASPRAKPDYNFNLSQRRIRSIENEISKYKGGVLRKYLKSGVLRVSQAPFGEEAAPAGIVDDINDPKSIYTIEASRERRVEIIEVKD